MLRVFFSVESNSILLARHTAPLLIKLVVGVRRGNGELVLVVGKDALSEDWEADLWVHPPSMLQEGFWS